jgi:hypothetical protein
VAVPMPLARPGAGGRRQRLTPNWSRPATSPSRVRLRLRHGSS